MNCRLSGNNLNSLFIIDIDDKPLPPELLAFARVRDVEIVKHICKWYPLTDLIEVLKLRHIPSLFFCKVRFSVFYMRKGGTAKKHSPPFSVFCSGYNNVEKSRPHSSIVTARL